MKSKLMLSVILVSLIFGVLSLYAQEASPSQYFYVIKRLLPNVSEVSIFMAPELIEEKKLSINRAALQNKLTVKIFPIASAIELGKNIRQLKDGGVLIVYSSNVLLSKSSAVYVLKKCIEKNIAVVSSSQIYSDLGALLGLIRGEDNKLKVVLNLKKYASLQSQITQDKIQLAGVTQVIE